MSKREKKSPAPAKAGPVLPEKLQRSLDLRRAAIDQRVAKPSPRTVPQHQGPRHQARGS
jgi:hypothetical protein